jgi:hypothetical protein
MPIRVATRLLASSRQQADDLRFRTPGDRVRGRRLRTAAVTATVLVPALALSAGCSGSKAKTPDPGTIRASGAVSTAKLTSALLTSSDVPHVQVMPAGSKTQLLGGATKADNPACQPIADQWSSRPKHPRQVYTGAMVTDTTDKDKKAKAITLEVIASYTPGTARSVLDELTTALRTCRNFKATRDTGAVTTFSVQPVQPATGAAPLGDQQATYTIADTARGAAGIVLVTVVRSGDTTAAYETVRADHQPATLRPSIPLKQAEKLKDAATGK